MVSAPKESQGPGFDSCWECNSSHGCIALHCKDPFMITPPLFGYDLNNVERMYEHHHLFIMFF